MQLQVIAILTLSLNELAHVLVYIFHLQNFENVRPLARIFNQESRHEVFQVLRVDVGYRVLLVLHDLKDQSKQVLGCERMFKRRKLV